MNPYYQSALEIAHRKLARDEQPGRLKSPRLGTGGGFIDTFLWDTAFSAHWAKYHADDFPLEDSLDNFYLCQDDDGFISRQIMPNGISLWSKEHPVSFAPPLLSWIELDLHERGLFPDRLAKVYPHLRALHAFNRRWRRPDGLYFSDMWGCGMDDIPRWNTLDDLRDTSAGIQLERKHIIPADAKGDRLFAGMSTGYGMQRMNFNWNRQVGWIDTNCQVAFDTLNLLKMSKILKRDAETTEYQSEYDQLSTLINEKLYDEKAGIYRDLLGDNLVNHKHIGAFWALISEVATEERAERLCEHLLDENTFGLPCGIPGVARDDTAFGTTKECYWCGPVWCPTEYMVLVGLQRMKHEELARKLARRFYNATRSIWETTGTIWENYSPLQCQTPSPAAGKDFCGWSALAPITIYREFVAE